MPIVKWPIPIIGKLADNRPIRLSADSRCTSIYTEPDPVLMLDVVAALWQVIEIVCSLRKVEQLFHKS